MPLIVPQLELDIAHVCNLHCFGCAHYSNYALKGLVPFETASSWLAAWAARLTPRTFTLLGGEPTLNPDLCRLIRFAATLWPDSRREVISNGLFLARHPDLFPTLRETRTYLDISLHSRHDQRYLARMIKVLEDVRAQAAAHGVKVNLRESTTWFHVAYRGVGPGMRPFAEGNPAKSWQVCVNKSCITLHQGRLWKCPPLAFLGLIADKFDLHGVADWQPYLAYRGLELSADDEALAAFFSAAAEPVCAMCPTRPNLVDNLNVTDPYPRPPSATARPDPPLPFRKVPVRPDRSALQDASPTDQPCRE
jgi:hypothetical protein